MRGHHASARLADLAVRVGRVLLYLEDRVAVDASSDSRSYTAVSLAAGDEGRWRRGGAGGDAGGYALPRPVPGSVGGRGDQARGGRPGLGAVATSSRPSRLLPQATRYSRHIVAGVPAAHLPEPSPEASATREPTDLAELVAGTSSAATVLADYFFPADSASSASAWAARKYLFRPRSPTVLTLNACCDAAASPVRDPGQGAHRRLGGLPPSPSATSGMVG